MKEKVTIFNIRPGELRLVLQLMLILAVNTLVLELSDVVSTAGFVSKVGAGQVMWLWVIDMSISVLAVGVYAVAVDKIPRVRLLSWLMGGFAVLFFILEMLFSLGAPDWFTYPLLYILSDQQYAIFPLAFWALANDLFTSSEARRLFPVITVGVAVGSILGNGIAAGAGFFLQQAESGPYALLTLGGLLFLAGFGLIQWTFSKRTVRARQARDESFDVRQTVNVGWDYIKNLPIFRYLAISMLLAGLAFTILEYHFLFSIEQAVSNNAQQFQAFYGIYKLVMIITIMLVQSFLSTRLLERITLKNSFFVQPAALAIGMAAALATVFTSLPLLAGSAAGRFIARVTQQSWDEPARKSLENLIPDERRGRVSVFIDRYFYDISTVIGSLFLGILLLLPRLSLLNETSAIKIYLAIALAASLVAVWAGFQLRKRYDQSLLDWRFSRSRRKSVLDGIDF